MDNLAETLRRAPADMLGTENEWLYWAIHDAANILDSGTNIPDEGRCRFRCRTNREALEFGFDAGAADTFNRGKIICDELEREVKQRTYKEWKRGLNGD